MRVSEEVVKERKDYVRDNYKKSNIEIAKVLGVEHSTVASYRQLLIDEGEIPRKLPFVETLSDRQIKDVVSLYNKGLKLVEIERKSGFKRHQVQSVLKRAERDGYILKKRKKRTRNVYKLDDADIQYMIDFSNEHTVEEFAEILEISYTLASRTLSELERDGRIKERKRKNNKLSDHDIEFITKNYGVMRTRDIATALEINVSTVTFHVDRLRKKGVDIKPSLQKRYFFSDEEVQKIKEMYPDNTHREIANAIGKDKQAVSNKIYRMIYKGELDYKYK